VQATGVILNPWWEVPQSISREVAGKAGYVAVKGKDGKVQRWRQPPGPANALGKVKFVMQNGQNIYLHDTNARSRFNGQLRALSHGCIRTENIMDLAKELLADDGGEWTADKVDATVASGKSQLAKFVKPLPVYIVYFSAAALNDGTIVNYSDLYGRDAKVLAALNDNAVPKPKAVAKPKTQTASR
jgi:murein L,D-transpeptidase YcbB/YkuD